MSRLSARRTLTLLWAGILSASCSGDPPGHAIGTYKVVMKLEENTCGPGALPLADGYSYSVELRADEPRGYWRVPHVGPITGTYRDGAFSFTTKATLELGNADAGTAGCLVIREELLEGHVTLADAGSPDAAEPQTDAASAQPPAADAAGDAGSETSADAGHAGAASGDASADAAPLTGEHTISFYPDPQGRCAGAQGPLGTFERLPCSARYGLTGSARDSF